MTGRAWLRHPAATIRPPRCPTSLERFPTWEAAELAIHTYDPYTATTPCPHPQCGGWHHTPAEPPPPARDEEQR
ncbi:hypothetical protein [Streptomyces sp. NPDC001652]|uniref:hypothetical protein n=1 Tax=Streptomyces sp. NPDC001652 TaxID=3154393 RepID=UPI00331CA96E